MEQMREERKKKEEEEDAKRLEESIEATKKQIDSEVQAVGMKSADQSPLKDKLSKLEEMRKQEQDAWNKKSFEVAPPEPTKDNMNFEVAPPEPIKESTISHITPEEPSKKEKIQPEDLL